MVYCELLGLSQPLAHRTQVAVEPIVSPYAPIPATDPFVTPILLYSYKTLRSTYVVPVLSSQSRPRITPLITYRHSPRLTAPFLIYRPAPHFEMEAKKLGRQKMEKEAENTGPYGYKHQGVTTVSTGPSHNLTESTTPATETAIHTW